MRRVVLLLAVTAVTMAVASGMALAGVTLIGTDGDDILKGTVEPDSIIGEDGDDEIYGQRGSDSLQGGSGNDGILAGPLKESARDTVSGGDGDDLIDVSNLPARRDTVTCGSGLDSVEADSTDVVAEDCENVNRI